MIPVLRALVALCLAVLGACDRSPTSTGPAGPTRPSAGPSTPTSFASARRIVPASATAVDFVCALVGPERIAGVPEQAIDYSILHSDDPRWAATPRFFAYQAEPVLALEPDLVVVCPYQSRDAHERLEGGGVPVFQLTEVATWDEARAMLLAVGDRLGERTKADELVADLDRRVAALERAAEARKGVRAMCYSNFGSQGWSAGSHTTIGEIMRLAGVTNVVAESGRRGHLTVSFEELIQLDPDVIVVGAPLTTPSSSAGDRGGASEALLLREPTLAGLRAVRDRRILVLPAWLFATGSHEIVHAAELLSEELDQLLARTSEAGRR
ncbi:MAG: ABC transporter substrate-binding protein [Planctomycetes bacterium]|nr:ABC transporter substrate-binding protein [Planctomycetota bacterium]